MFLEAPVGALSINPFLNSFGHRKAFSSEHPMTPHRIQFGEAVWENLLVFKLDNSLTLLKMILVDPTKQITLANIFHEPPAVSQPGPCGAADSSVQILFCDQTRQLTFRLSIRLASEVGTILLQESALSEHSHLLLHSN